MCNQRLFCLLWVAAALHAAHPDQASPLLESRQVEEIRLTVRPSDWRALTENYLQNFYYPATLEWRGHLIEDVAIRSRGNGSRNQLKPSLRLDFNRFAPQSFLGLSSLVLLNLTQDVPMLREYLSLSLFRQAGIPAPREAFARLTVNGAPMGLYLAAEEISKEFLLRHYGEDNGSLFEYDWCRAWDWSPIPGEPESYTPSPFSPKTHEKKPDNPSLVRLIRSIEAAAGADPLAPAWAEIDTALLIEYLAVEYYSGEMDGLTGEYGTNNFYLYRGHANPQFQFIPWDKSATFFYHDMPLFYNHEANVLVRKLMSVPEYRQDFLTAVRRILALAGGEGGWLEQEFLFTSALIRPFVLEDRLKPYSNDEYEQQTAVTHYFIRERARLVAQYLEEVQ